MNHPVTQIVLLLFAAWIVLGAIQRLLGSLFLMLLIVLALLLVTSLYMLRHQRQRLAVAYRKPIGKLLIDIVCRITANQPPVEEDYKLQLTTDFLLREPRDFEWAANRIRSEVFGHDSAIKDLCHDLDERVALRSISTRSKANRPLATYMMVGPPGIGKCHLAYSIARHLYREGNATAFDLLNHSGNSSQHETLFGNSSVEGSLTKSVRRHPFQVIVLENFNHAESSVREEVHSILRTGTCVDPRNRNVISFEQVVFFLSIAASLPGLDNELRDSLSELAWKDRVNETLTSDFDIDPSIVALINVVTIAQTPSGLDQARVIALLMAEECRRYELELDYVDPEILADEVGLFRNSHGYALSKSYISEKLQRSILEAKNNHVSHLILTKETWQNSNKEMAYTS